MSSPMKIRTSDLEKTAKAMHLRRDFCDVTGLIRSIQRAEGHSECFRRDHVGCDQIECAWRSYCIEDSGQRIGSPLCETKLNRA